MAKKEYKISAKKPSGNEKLEDYAYREMRQSIIQAEYKPGERLNERSMAEKLGISRAPVRQAMKRLESEGYLNTVQRGGTYVRSLSAFEYLMSFEVRESLEICAIKRACQSMTSENIDKLRKLARKFKNIPHTPHEKKEYAIRLQDVEFHTFLLKNCGNPVLSEITVHCIPVFLGFFDGMTGPRKNPVLEDDKDIQKQLDFLTKQHEELVDMIEKRDAEAAVEMTIRNFKEKRKDAEVLSEQAEFDDSDSPLFG
ncbi:MAG: GntR family transcriptional regulator [Planctomycetota bacterium]|jgi:DNA-binding GntR family transcriptional regulator